MRVLVISNVYAPLDVGGYERMCRDVMSKLSHEHDVTVVTAPVPRENTEAREPLRPFSDGAIRVEPVLPWHKAGKVGRYATAVRATRECAAAFQAVLDSTRPDIVYCWNGSGIPSIWLQIVADRRIPVAFHVAEHWFSVINEHDPFMRYRFRVEPTPAHRMMGVALRSIARAEGMAVAKPGTDISVSVSWCSAFMRESRREPLGLKVAHDLVLPPQPPDRDLFLSVDRHAVGSDFVFVGRLVEHKGVEVAIRALARLNESGGAPSRLRVFGRGTAEYEARLKDVVGHLRLEDAVIFEGGRGPKEIAAALGRARAALVPSIWDEPYGLVCAEAALAATPVIATRSGGLTEIVSDGLEALFVAKGDHVELAAAMQRTLDDPDASEERGRRSRTRLRSYSAADDLQGHRAFLAEAASIPPTR